MPRRQLGWTEQDEVANVRIETERASSPLPPSAEADTTGAISSSTPKLRKSTKTVQWHDGAQEQQRGFGKPQYKQDSITMELPQSKRPRLRGPWRSSILILATTLVSICLLLNVIHSFTTRQLDPKGCRPVTMYPIYAKYEGFDTEHTLFASKYSLYLYREGYVNENFEVKGVPVLFITGNAGSYRQVRSLASESAKYWHDVLSRDPELASKGLRDFDFFAGDFNEDITAFHGQTMLDQAEYLNDAIAFILSLYHDPQNPRRDANMPDPTSVIIIGHSMGGIVARTMLTLPNYQANSINTIITLSSPHARAPVSFDEDIVSTYSRINSYWRESYSQDLAAKNPLSELTLISLVGGGLDTVVPSDYASLASLVPETHGFTVFTSSMPTVWTGCDHLSILWCDQLRKAIVKALYDVVDVRQPSQTKPRSERMATFRKRFLTGMEREIEQSPPSATRSDCQVTVRVGSNRLLSSSERIVLRKFGEYGKEFTYLMTIPTTAQSSERKLISLLSNQPADDTGAIRNVDICLCSATPGHGPEFERLHSGLSPDELANGDTRLKCRPAAEDLIKLPSSTATTNHPFDAVEPFSYLQYEIANPSEYEFLAVVDKNMSPANGWLVAEIRDIKDVQISSQASLFQLLVGGLHLTLPAGRPMMIDIKIPAIFSSLLVYKFQMGAQSCAAGALFPPFLRQHIESPYESKYFVNVKSADINLHGVSPFMPPQLRSAAQNNGLSLQIWSDPTCEASLDVSLKPDIMGSFGKFVMRYRTIFPAMPLVVIALVLRKQFVVHDQTGVFITFFDSLNRCMRSSLPILLITTTLFSLALTGTSTSHRLSSLPGNATESVIDYTKNDLLLGSPDPLFWFLVPIAGILGVGACVLVNYAALSLLHILHSANAIISSLGSKLRRNHHRRATGNVFSTTPPKRRFIVTALLFILISTVIPYQFAYIVACVIQLITCTKALRASQESQSNATRNFYNYSHSILVLMLWVLPINMPVLVVWIHNLAVHWLTPFTSHHNILSIMPFVILVESLTGGTMIPQVTSSFRHITNILFFGLAIYAVLYGVTYAYQLHDIANLIAAWLVIVQFSALDLSVGRLTKIAGGRDTGPEPHVKKRP